MYVCMYPYLRLYYYYITIILLLCYYYTYNSEDSKEISASSHAMKTTKIENPWEQASHTARIVSTPKLHDCVMYVVYYVSDL